MAYIVSEKKRQRDASQRTAKAHPSLQKQREERARALQLLIPQLRAANGRWSDGQKVYEGDAVRQMKAQAVNRLINIRGNDVRQNAGMYMKNLFNGSSYLGQSADENMPDFLTRLITKHTQHPDSGSMHRRRNALRVLRKHYPDHYTALPFQLRYSKEEAIQVFASRTKRNWVLKEDMPLEEYGITVSAGAKAHPTRDGGFQIGQNGTSIGFRVDEDAARRMTPAEARARDRRIFDHELEKEALKNRLDEIDDLGL